MPEATANRTMTLNPAQGRGVDPRHLPIIAAAAAAMVKQPVHLHRVVIAAASAATVLTRSDHLHRVVTMAAAAAAARLKDRPRVRRVAIPQRPANDGWATQGRVRLMVTRHPKLH